MGRSGAMPAYLRQKGFADRLTARLAVRASAVAFLGLALFHALDRGGHFDDPASPFYNLEGRMAAVIGQAAERIEVRGLKYHAPRNVLAAIGIRAGGSMLGFDPQSARKLLENLDWVKRARLAKVYPNGLVIDIVEREPIALWQTAGEFYPVDGEGLAIASLPAGRFAHLPVVTGEGGNKAAKSLVNHLNTHPGIKSQLRAAARVGKRRWNLYFASGLKVMLPEKDPAGALDRLERLDAATGLFSRDLQVLDLRLPGRVALRPAGRKNG